MKTAEVEVEMVGRRGVVERQFNERRGRTFLQSEVEGAVVWDTIRVELQRRREQLAEEVIRDKQRAETVRTEVVEGSRRADRLERARNPVLMDQRDSVDEVRSETEEEGGMAEEGVDSRTAKTFRIRPAEAVEVPTLTISCLRGLSCSMHPRRLREIKAIQCETGHTDKVLRSTTKMEEMACSMSRRRLLPSRLQSRVERSGATTR